MGQKVSPIGMRIGINRDWDAIWYANNTQVADLLQEDLKIRKFIEKTYAKAQVSRVIIERVKSQNKSRIKISVFTARPGIVIGHDAETKNEVIKKLQYLTKKDIILNVVEIKKAELDATLVARSIAEQLENRASFRRVQKVAIQRALKAGAKGAKTLISGRLGGAEMARSEGYNEGRVPLQTLRADVDYAVAEATTTYGKLGIKVWIYKGELFEIPARVQEPRKPRVQKDGQKPAEGKQAKPRAPRTPKAQADKGGNE